MKTRHLTRTVGDVEVWIGNFLDETLGAPPPPGTRPSASSGETRARRTGGWQLLWHTERGGYAGFGSVCQATPAGHLELQSDDL